MIRYAVVLSALLSTSIDAEAKMLCTVVADVASGAIVHEEGDCRTRVTPASTFKIALALMGFDGGFLDSAQAPLLTIKSGEADWGGAEWKKPTDPQRWMKYSVVWYSQRISAALGYERFAAQVKALGYGNADVSGDPGKDNALTRSWIGSSLKIAPIEQVDFLRRLVTGRLPASSAATAKTMAIIEATPAGRWTVHGKTGSAFPRKADGSLDRARGWGWFVGWANDGDRTYAFARLDQDAAREPVSGGLRAKEKFLATWPALAKSMPL